VPYNEDQDSAVEVENKKQQANASRSICLKEDEKRLGTRGNR